MMKKSRTFQIFLKKLPSPLLMRPYAIIFIEASTTKITVVEISILSKIL
jgi:hypothetical protein